MSVRPASRNRRIPTIDTPPSAVPERDGDRYLNRELSWLEFNRRVLAEASNPANPPLERCRFLSIFESNLDEFYMVRVSGLVEQIEGGVVEASPDGLSPEEQLIRVAAVVGPMRRTASEIWTRELGPVLAEAGVELLTWEALAARRQADLRRWFEHEVFPLCTPLVLDPHRRCRSSPIGA